MENQKLSKELVNHLLRYCYDTGELIWKPRDRSWFSRGQDCTRWNNRFAGKVAGNILNKPCGYSSKYVKILGKSYQAHIIVWLLHYGCLPNCDIDHINRDGTDNRISNLRLVSKSVNMRNTKMYRSNSSGVKGVSLLKGRWRSRINVNNVDIHLGLYQDRFDAIAARKSAEVKYNFR